MTAAVVSVSGGLASWATAMLARDKYDTVHYLFNDVIIEDADLYRFLLEGMAAVLRQPKPLDLIARALYLPDVDSDEHVAIRKRELSEIRAEAMRRLPGFTWQADGRTPWEAWRDERFIGNSRTAHCSKLLKAKMGDTWAAAHAPGAVQEYGMYWDELDRILKLERVLPSPVGRTLYESGLLHSDIALWAAREGIQTPRAYGQGYTHNNCSGLCCRAGKRHWAHKYLLAPLEARYFAEKEAELLRDLPHALPMLTDRVKGEKLPVPLHEFFNRLDQLPTLLSTLDDMDSGCGCVFDAMTAEPVPA